MKNRYDIIEAALQEISRFLIDTDWPLDVSFRYTEDGVLTYKLDANASFDIPDPQFFQETLTK